MLDCTAAMLRDAVQNTGDATTPEEYLSRKFMRGMEWGNPNVSGFSASIKSSFFAEPLPDPPPLSDDPTADFILSRYPDLFKIVCPYNIPRLKVLLQDHPDKPFVDSVLKGLHSGFWPMSALPSDRINDYQNQKSCENHQEILEKQSEEGVQGCRYSREFSTLLPGMKVVPLCLIPKKGSEKMRVCSDMSYGSPSPNSLVDKSKIKNCMDSLISFAPFLIEKRRN